MVFLPDGRLLVTERIDGGRLTVVTPAGGKSAPVTGLPTTAGLLDVALDPQFATNRFVYLSYIERDATAARIGAGASNPSLGPSGLAVARGTLVLDGVGGGRIDNLSTIWRQLPKIVSLPGSGEYGGRLAFSPSDGSLFITAGDRQEFEPPQQLANTVGKTIRIRADGSIPADNPYVGIAGADPSIWTSGHRNPYGMAFDLNGQLWQHEMGPLGGDEFNLISRSANYGWPRASMGSDYGGADIPDHRPGDGFFAPAAFWIPVIAPAGMIFYTGSVFETWRGDAIITGLQSRGIVRVRLNGTGATEVQRIPLGARIREVEQGPDGAIWVLEDGAAGRLLKLNPTF